MIISNYLYRGQAKKMVREIVKEELATISKEENQVIKSQDFLSKKYDDLAVKIKKL